MAMVSRCRVCESIPGRETWNVRRSRAAQHTEKTGHNDFRLVKERRISGAKRRWRRRERERAEERERERDAVQPQESEPEEPALNSDLEKKLQVLRRTD